MGSSAPRARVFAHIYRVVLAIPPGRVMTYGAVARAAGLPHGARVVGYAMRASLSAQPLPWQRVVGLRRRGVGGISIRDPIGAALQRRLLEDEGVQLAPGGAIDLERYGWGG